LASAGAFLIILYVNNGPSAAQSNVSPLDGVTWIEWERDYAEGVPPFNDLVIEAKYRLCVAMVYNFSLVPIQVTVRNVGNVTLRDLVVVVLVEDETGHIRGSGGASPSVSATGDKVIEENFLYNVPVLLRGQELRIHIVSSIQQTMVIDKKLLLVRTFPGPDWSEAPRMLLFFLTFTSLPIGLGTFVPPGLRRRAEHWWLRSFRGNELIPAVLLVCLVVLLAVYWNIICKMFYFL
jgi:hypothetical protein